jgi:hypothetical protein
MKRLIAIRHVLMLAIPALLLTGLTPDGVRSVQAKSIDTGGAGPSLTAAIHIATKGGRKPSLGGPALHRLSISRAFRVRGRVSLPNPFRTKEARAFQHQVRAVDPRHVAVFGRVVSQRPGLLIIRQLPWQAHGGNGSRIAYAKTSSVAGAGTALIPVYVTQRTLVASIGGMAALRAGVPVLVGGSVVNHRFGAYIISTLQRVAPGGAQLYRALSNQLVKLPRSAVSPPRRLPVRRTSPLDTNNLNFTGEFGGPSFNYNTDLGDIDIFDLGIFSVHLEKFSFLASLDGWTYNWPMQFTGSPASPLVMTEQNSVGLDVIPQHGGSGTFTDTFSGGIGVNVGIGFHIHTALGCGDVGLDSCDFHPTLNLGIGLLNETQDPAPLAVGTDLNVPSVECPNIGFNIPDTSISAADVGLCNTFLIHGSNFSAGVSATGATMTPTNLSFDGTNAQSVNLTPTANPVDVMLNNFFWNPTLDYGLHPRIRVAMQTVWTGPSVIIASDAVPMIADAATRSAAGFNDVVGQFAQPSSTDFIFPASKEPTTITSGSPASGDYHDAATMSATLKDSLGRAVSGKTLSFVLNNSATETCQGVTNGLGVATCQITPTDVPAVGSLSITFAGDDQYLSSSASPAFTITKEESSTTYTGDTTQDYHDTTHVGATLVEDASGPAITGQALSFTLGTQTCGSEASTDSAGSAGCHITINQQSGQYDVGASFAGNAYYLASSTNITKGFTVTREETTLTYTGDPLIANNRPAVLKAVLKEDGSVPPNPAGQTIVLTLGDGSTLPAQTCDGTTDSTGLAQCTITTVNQPLGTAHMTAAFAGDSYYLPASDKQDRLVFSYLPAGGSFAVGDMTAATATSRSTVNFWGSQWAKNNSLSGGGAPDSFKGFVQRFTPAGDPTCGATWTTGPGNAPGPPATVPSYIAVVVPSSVTKSGNTISGNTMKIVIVKTDPGYGPDPGSPGTGSIVATLCG